MEILLDIIGIMFMSFVLIQTAFLLGRMERWHREERQKRREEDAYWKEWRRKKGREILKRGR